MPESKHPEPQGLERLLAIARRIEAKPWNRPGSDKTWVLTTLESYHRFRKEILRARRIDPDE